MSPWIGNNHSAWPLTKGTQSGTLREYGDLKKLTTRQICDIVREMEGVTEKDHFGSDAFVAHGRIFATVWHDKNQVNLMLNLEQQRSFVGIDGEGFSPLVNAWGRKGATCIHVEFADPKDVAEGLRAAWLNSKKKSPSDPRKRKPAKAKKSKKA